RAVDTLVGDRVLPVEQMAVLFFESVEDLTLEGIALDVADTRLDFPLVPRRARPRRQDCHTVILGDGTQLGVDLGIKLVAMLYTGFQIVQDKSLRRAA